MNEDDNNPSAPSYENIFNNEVDNGYIDELSNLPDLDQQ